MYHGKQKLESVKQANTGVCSMVYVVRVRGGGGGGGGAG